MFPNLIGAVVFAWTFWIVGNFALLVASALLHKPDHPCFNGFKIIMPAWVHDKFTPSEIAAIVAHEEGHRALMHVWENFARVCIFSSVTLARRHHQEMEADDHAIEAGHAKALASALMKLPQHSSTSARIERILRTYC